MAGRPTARPTCLRRLLAALTGLLVFVGSISVPPLMPAVEAAAPPQLPHILFYHTDHLGSPTLITDEHGDVVERIGYKPFGSVHRREVSPDSSATRSLGHSATRLGFTGQREDEASGLVLFPARPYDPELGRFLQPDPFVQDPADPQSLNRYSYVRNNPVNLVDPSGYGGIRWVARLVGAVVGAIIGFVITSPEGAVAGATWGFAIGDSVGAAIEQHQEQRPTSPPPLPIPPLPASPSAASLRGPPSERGSQAGGEAPIGGVVTPGALRVVEGAQALGADLAQVEAASALWLLSFGLAPAAAALVAIEASPVAQEALGAVGIRGTDRLLREMARTDSRAGRLLSELLGFRGGFADRFGRLGSLLAAGGLIHDVAGTLGDAALTADQKVLMVNQQFVRAELTTAGGLVGATIGEAVASSPIVFGALAGSPFVAAPLAIGFGAFFALRGKAAGNFLLERLQREFFLHTVREQAFFDRA